jgi:hypothetical protein
VSCNGRKSVHITDGSAEVASSYSMSASQVQPYR